MFIFIEYVEKNSARPIGKGFSAGVSGSRLLRKAIRRWINMNHKETQDPRSPHMYTAQHET